MKSRCTHVTLTFVDNLPCYTPSTPHLHYFPTVFNFKFFSLLVTTLYLGPVHRAVNFVTSPNIYIIELAQLNCTWTEVLQII